MIPVKHYLENPLHTNISMLLPVGRFLNRRVAEAEKGDRLIFMDGLVGEVVYVCVIRLYSDEAESLSWLIYDLPIEKVFGEMVLNWKYEPYKDNIIHLVVKKIAYVGEEDDSQDTTQ